MSLYLILAGIAVAWVAAYALLLVLKSRVSASRLENITLYPLFLMLRTRSVITPLDKIAGRYPRLWDALSRVAIVTGLGMGALAIYILASNLATYLFRPETVGVQNIVIPLIIGVTIRLEHIPYLLIAFGIVLLTHEGMHGIIARREGIPVKSAGVFLIFILPGGFVEPEEKAFREASPDAKMRVAAVGSFANLVVGLIVILLTIGIYQPFESGLIIIQTDENSRLPENEVIVSVEGVPVNRYTLAQNITLGEKIVVKGIRDTYEFQIREEFIGRQVPIGIIISALGAEQVDYYYSLRFGQLDPNVTYILYRTLGWLQLVSLGVAIFNMLPIYMLDGNLMLRAFLEKYTKDPKKIHGVALTATILSLALLIANIAFTYQTFGFFQL